MRKDAVRSPFLAFALAVVLLLPVLPAAIAAGLTEYKLGEATFNVPSDWKVTEHRKNRGYTFESANGEMAFWAEWWLQDEPILGYPDIVSHKTVVVDGRKATYVHTRTNSLNSFAAVFDQPRADGRKFLMHLESSSERRASLASIFDRLLSRTAFKEGDAGRQKTKPQAVSPSEESGVSVPAAAQEMSAGPAGIAVNAPDGWRIARTERDGARIVTISSPGRLAVALLAVFPAASDSAAGALIEDFKALYYGDYVLPNEILGNGERTIGGVGGAFVEMTGDTYTIEGVRIGFSTGRSWFFEAVDGSTGYVAATVSAETIPASDREGLDAMIASIRFGEPAVSGEASVEAPAGAVGDLAASTVGDCDFGQSDWAKKARNVLKRHSGSRFLWAGVCGDGARPIVAGEFPFDPNGPTGDFFNPLYFDLLDAAGAQGFILAVPEDRLMIEVIAASDSEVSIEFSEFPETLRPEGGLDVAPEPERETFGAPRKDLPAKPAEAGLIRTAGMDDPALWLLPNESQKLVLFEGNDDTSRWTHYASSKSGFELLARFEDSGFTVKVPEKSGKTFAGLSSGLPLVWLDQMGPGAETRVTWSFDPSATSDFTLALATQFNLNGNPPGKDNAVLDWHGGRAVFSINDSVVWRAETPVVPPAEVSLVITHEGIWVDAQGFPADIDPWRPVFGGVKVSGIGAEGQGLRVYAFAQPEKADLAARMRIMTITLTRKAGEAVADQPSGGVEPLPTTTLFSGKPIDTWEVTDVSKGGLQDYVHFDDRGLVVDIPERKAESAWAGLLSSKPLILTDERFVSASQTVSFRYDQRASSGIYVAFGANRVADIWRSGLRAAIQIRKAADDPFAGDYVLTLRSGPAPYGVWERHLSAEWIESRWDGRLDIEFRPGSVAVTLKDGPTVRGTQFNILPGTELYATVYSHPGVPYGPASLVLSEIAQRMDLPGGIDRAGRWSYVNIEDFEPKGFLSDIAVLGDEPPAKGLPSGVIETLIIPPTLDPAPLPPQETEKHGALDLWQILSLFNPIGSAEAAEDCSEAIDQHLDEARMVDMTLAASPDLIASALDLGEQLLGTVSLGTGTADKARETLVNAVTAYRDGAAIGSDLAAGKDAEATLRIMGAVLNVGLSSGAYDKDPVVRKALDANASSAWTRAIADLDESDAKQMIVRLREKMKLPDATSASAVDRAYKALRDNIDKGVSLDLGTVAGTASGGGTRIEMIGLAAFTLTDTALATFAPPYRVAKATAKLAADGVAAGRAFVVNEQVRTAYGIWVEEKKKNDGMGALDFYRALSVRTTAMPLAEVKTILVARGSEAGDAAAERELFAIYEKWYAAETKAASASDRYAGLKERYGKLEAGCRNALEKSLWPDSRSALGESWKKFMAAKTYGAGGSDAWGSYWNSCQPEIEMLKRYAQLEADNRQTLASLLPEGNDCRDPRIMNADVDRLICRQLEDGEGAYRQLVARVVEGCTAPDPLKLPPSKAFESFVSLTDERQQRVLGELGIKPSEDFYNCLCRAAGYGSSGTAQYYHPDTIGSYDRRYSCNQPGPPCIVSGYGCMRYPLPSAASHPVEAAAGTSGYRQIWATCMTKHPVGEAGTRLDALFQKKARAYSASSTAE